MNIALVSRCYHPSIGGVENLVRQTAHELSRHHKVSVLATNFETFRLPLRLMPLHGNLLARMHESCDDDEVRVNTLTPTWADRLKLLPIALKAVPKLRHRFCDQIDGIAYKSYRLTYFERMRRILSSADLVHSYSGYYMGWTAQEVARSLQIPFVCTGVVHPHEWGDDEKSVEYYKRSDAVIAFLEVERQYLISLGVPQERVHVIGVPADEPLAANPEDFRKHHDLKDKPMVLYVGRMMPRKGAKALINAAPLIWQHLPSLHIVFIGPAVGDSDQWFKGADPRIVHLGIVSEKEKANALAACDVFCMPSQSESFGTTFLEAWSYGKPVIGGRAYGSSELIEENDAGLVAGNDPHEIAKAILQLFQAPDLAARFGQKGKELAQSRYGLKNVVTQLEFIYKSIGNR